MTISEKEFLQRAEGVDFDHCSFCGRFFEDGEISFIGTIKNDQLRPAGFCCMEKLTSVISIDFIAPPSIHLAKAVYNILWGGNPSD